MRVRSAGFTLIELLIVIGIIVILLALLIPAVSKIRKSAQGAATQQEISTLVDAIQRYYNEFTAYPGPVNNLNIRDGVNLPLLATGLPANFDTQALGGKITGAENLVLGLLGGLKYDSATASVRYDPTMVGLGPNSLSATNPKRYAPYADAQNLSWRVDTATSKTTGHFKDDAGDADDTVIPEFVDKFSDAMPILYLRARVGGTSTLNTAADNPIISEPAPATLTTSRPGQYDVLQVIGYTGAFTGTWPTLTRDVATPPTGKSIGAGKRTRTQYFNASATPTYPSPGYHGLRTVNVNALLAPAGGVYTNYYYPWDAYPYFTNPSIANTPRQKDGYILISAGADRIYGTNDDICNFGTVP